MTGLELLGLLFVLGLLLIVIGRREDAAEHRRTLADLERTRYRTRREISAEKWGRRK